MMTDFDDYMADLAADVISNVNAWGLDPEDVTQAINDQIRLLSLDYAPIHSNVSPYLELRF